MIHVHHTSYLHAPTVLAVAPRPQHVAAFDFMAGRTRIPRIAAAVGREVVIFSIGVE